MFSCFADNLHQTKVTVIRSFLSLVFTPTMSPFPSRRFYCYKVSALLSHRVSRVALSVGVVEVVQLTVDPLRSVKVGIYYNLF